MQSGRGLVEHGAEGLDGLEVRLAGQHGAEGGRGAAGFVELGGQLRCGRLPDEPRVEHEGGAEAAALLD